MRFERIGSSARHDDLEHDEDAVRVLTASRAWFSESSSMASSSSFTPACGVSPIVSGAIRGQTRPVECTVLIVDDDARFRQVAAELLADRGYRVVGKAGGAAEGLALAEELRPDAVLVDVNLPDGDGLSVAERLSAEGASRVLLTSTDASATSDRLVWGSGAAGFVPKADLTSVALDRYLKG